MPLGKVFASLLIYGRPCYFSSMYMLMYVIGVGGVGIEVLDLMTNCRQDALDSWFCEVIRLLLCVQRRVMLERTTSGDYNLFLLNGVENFFYSAF